MLVRTPPERAFEALRGLGGAAGWPFGDWRGALDSLAGRTGRGGRRPQRLGVGDTVGFWRVAALERDRLLRLALDVRVPGRGWLEYEVSPDGVGTVVRQTAVFEPSGLLGRLYWYATYGFHAVVFAGMFRRVVARLQEPDDGS